MNALIINTSLLVNVLSDFLVDFLNYLFSHSFFNLFQANLFLFLNKLLNNYLKIIFCLFPAHRLLAGRLTECPGRCLTCRRERREDGRTRPNGHLRPATYRRCGMGGSLRRGGLLFKLRFLYLFF
jgi:hypothetical protein